MAVTREEAEALRAMGFRVEASLLDGTRAVLDLDSGVYITLVPGPENIHWSVWTADMGLYLAGGQDEKAVVAAHQASTWIESNWK